MKYLASLIVLLFPCFALAQQDAKIDNYVLRNNVQMAAQSMAYYTQCGLGNSPLNDTQKAQLVDNFILTQWALNQSQIENTPYNARQALENGKRYAQVNVIQHNRMIERMGCKAFKSIEERTKQMANTNLRSKYQVQYPNAKLPKALKPESTDKVLKNLKEMR